MKSKFQIRISQSIKILRISSCVFLVFSGLLLLAGCSDESKESGDKLPASVDLQEYSPFQKIGRWTYSWENRRGDRWRGVVEVTDRFDEAGITIVIVTDSTDAYGSSNGARSAYMWDNMGLKHLYRVTENGDSIKFQPPRLVVPVVLISGQTHESSYTFDLYSLQGKSGFGAQVNQKQRLVLSGPLKIGEHVWEDCVAVETVLSETYNNDLKKTKRMMTWYAKGIGAVKIITDIPPDSPGFEGSVTGILIAKR